MAKFEGGFLKNIQQIFPEIGLDLSSFASFPGRKFIMLILFFIFYLNSSFSFYFGTNIFVVWETVANRRKFFEKFAQNNGFDPHNPDNWYLQAMHKIKDVRV